MRDQPARYRRIALFAATIVGLTALAVAWTWSPMREWLDLDKIVNHLKQLGSASGPFAAVTGLAIASTIAVPLSFLTLVAVVAFEPALGSIYCLTGATIGAATSYGLGRHLGHEAITRLAGPRINLVSRRLAGHGILSVIIVRLFPVAPFAIVNMIAGASHIHFRDFIVGTIIGMIPGTIAIIIFADKIVQAIRHPSPITAVLVAITVTLILAGWWIFRRYIERSNRN